MKKSLIYIILAALTLTGCVKPFALNIDFALNRTDLRFAKDSSQAYFLVYSTTNWDIELEPELSWITLSLEKGEGNRQVNVYCEKNAGTSRGGYLTVTNSDGRQKQIYVSQNAGMDTPIYKPKDERLELFAIEVNPVISVTTNLDEASVAGATIDIICPGYDTPWISDVEISLEKVAFHVSALTGSEARTGSILITFPAAKWEESPCSSLITVTQTDQKPEISLLPQYDLDPDGNSPTAVVIETNWNPAYYSYDLSAYAFSDDSWIEEHSFDGNRTVNVRPAKNEESVRSVTMTCYLRNAAKDTLQSVSTTLTQKVAVKPLEPEDLTKGGKYANSFLIEKTDSALYSVDIKTLDGQAIEGAHSSKVLWQMSQKLIGDTYVKENKLFFITNPGETGNALIAVLSQSGKILWSYHIWVISSKLTELSWGGYVFMDRNLGALGVSNPTSSGASSTAGTHYQWGRKDPFPPVEKYTPTGNRDHCTIYPENDAVTFLTAQDGKSLQYCHEHPAEYLWGSAASGKEDWIDVQDADLWGKKSDKKSNYDPCPYGWEVPSETQMSGIFSKLKTASMSNFGFTISDDNGVSNFFPAQGYYRRTVNASSQLCNVGTYGWYWVRDTDAYNKSYIGGKRIQVISNASSRNIAAVANRWGANVRCVKQK